jgi:glycosyltransferase involved in cell wall biosynthesis
VTGTPVISVVVPAYNAGATLAATVQSIAEQVPAPMEIIVVDDGSTDDTADVASRLSGVRLIGRANGGPSAARNAGIAIARGEWIGFADADDTWLPGKLQLQAECAARYPDAILIAGDWVRGAQAPSAARTSSAAPHVRLFGYRDLLTLNRFQTSTVLVRTEALKRLGGFDASLDGVEDWDMWLRCSRLGPIAKLDVPLVVYRDEPGGYSKNLRRVYATMLLMLDRERRSPAMPSRTERTLRAWHHLRFAVGFWLAHDPQAARMALRDLARSRVMSAAPAATFRYLLPFLGRRLGRRMSLRRA